ncbi:hypothetical protein [Rarobacter incanus]|uniref:hypothetical protein n=1 Tax=Rarobacter incanus TaxID=153494 RepID=UPI00114DCC1A|nr:hypothetical protein [Rarobacter incanus]
MDESTPTLIGGRYRKEGAHALANELIVTWHGTDTVLDRRVLIVDVAATLEATGSSAGVGAVLDAARRAALVSDRRFVKLLDINHEGTDAFIVSEDITGPSVSSLPRATTWDARRVRALLGELASGLDAASRNGVHHQHISEDSVYLSRRGPQLYGLGFLPLLLGTEALSGDDASLVDCDQLRSVGRRLVAGHADEFDDAALVDVLDVEHVYVRPARIATELDPWDLASLTELADPAGPGASAPSAADQTADLVRRSALSQLANISDDLNPPGTPPPAPPAPGAGTHGTGSNPTRVSTGVPVAAAASSLLSPVLPATDPAAASAEAPVFQPVSAAAAATAPAAPAPAAAKGRFQVGSTLAVLLLVGGILVTGGFWAVAALTDNLQPTHVVQSLRDSQGSGGTTTGGKSSNATPKATKSATAVPPVIDSVASLDPDGDNNEHPELADRAIDEDQATYWISRTYKTANFGGYSRRGIGFAIKLEKATTVSQLYVITENTGGKFELRATSDAKPWGGDLVAKGSFDQDMDIVLNKPIKTDELVLWVTELPELSSGSYGLKIAEVQVL